MSRKRKKILIISVPIIIIVLVSIVLLILYIKTDFLKSDKTLFLKYVSQNIDVMKAVLDNTNEKEYTNLLRQNKFESTADLSATYTEKVNTSQENKKNDINKLKLTIDTQSEYLNDYLYKNIKLLFNDSNLLTTEYLHDGETYGIRFPEEFGQFLAVKSENLKQVASDAGMTEEQVNFVPNSFNEIYLNSLYTFSDEEISSIQSKYIELISNNVGSDKYSRQKDALITIGENSINTNAYSITLTQEQANDVYIIILEELKADEIILNKISNIEPYLNIYYTIKGQESTNISLKDLYIAKIQEKIDNIQKNNIGTNQVKYTVYEANGNTVRTQIQEETSQITLDLNVTENSLGIELESEIASQEQENKNNIQIQKKHDSEESTFSIKTKKILGDVTSKTEIYRNIKMNESNPTTETGITYNDGKDNLLELKYNENISLNQQFNRAVEADQKNTVILNNYDSRNIPVWINQVKQFLDKRLQDNQAIVTNVTQIDVIRSNFWQTTDTNCS